MSASDVAVLETRLDNIEKELERLNKTLIGNGSKGMLERVANLEQAHMDSEKADSKRLWTIGLVVSIITVAVNVILKLV